MNTTQARGSRQLYVQTQVCIAAPRTTHARQFQRSNGLEANKPNGQFIKGFPLPWEFLSLLCPRYTLALNIAISEVLNNNELL